jgi:trans-aconitate 2-methyltransferase
MAWDPTHYMKFGDERTRPSVDLAARIKVENPTQIVDLGCGPGNSTQILRQKWPQARVLGVDNSPEMLKAAAESYPDQEWMLADIASWQPAQTFDVIFSNATLQWLPDHRTLARRLLSLFSSGGALAFQIPSATFATIRTLIYDISREATWNARMDVPRKAHTMESPAFYYDALVDVASELDLWETDYQHVLPSRSAVVDWISSTGLRPFLAVLDTEKERSEFLAELHRRVADSYALRADGKVLFPFRRTFVIAYR